MGEIGEDGRRTYQDRNEPKKKVRRYKTNKARRFQTFDTVLYIIGISILYIVHVPNKASKQE